MLSLTTEFCEEVRSLDPLGLDDKLSRLPSLNKNSDLRSLINILKEIEIAKITQMSSLSEAEALAIVRDLGMYFSSIKRLGVEPMAEAPGLTSFLLAYSENLNLVPRNTVLHYGPWNPKGARERTFVGEEEHYLIESTRVCSICIEKCFLRLTELANVPPADPWMTEQLDEIHDSLQVLVTSMREVARKVHPVNFFAKQLRPFMEEIDVGGKNFFGPAAAQVPMYLIDRVLWSHSQTSQTHQDLQNELVEYGLPEWRAQLQAVKTPLANRIHEALSQSPEDTQIRKCCESLHRILHLLTGFRKIHRGVAIKSYSSSEALYNRGSAGASPEVLTEVLVQTELSEKRLHELAAKE